MMAAAMLRSLVGRPSGRVWTALRMGGLAVGLALRDIRMDRRLVLCMVLAMAAVLAPLLVLFGLKFGIVSGLREQLRSHPQMRELRPVGQFRLDDAWFDRLRDRDDVAFLVPNTRYLTATIRLGDGGRVAPLDTEMIPTAPGDPLFPAGIPIPETLTKVVLSRRAAEKLGLAAGDTVPGEIGRTVDDRRETLVLDLTVAGVLPTEAFERDAAFVPLDLLLETERFREGMAAPLIGGTGTAPPEDPRTFASFRIYAGDVDQVEGLRDHLAAEHIDTLTRLSDIRLIQRFDTGLTFVFLIIAVLGGGGYLVSLAVSLAATMETRTRQFGLLRLVGFQSLSIGLFPLVHALITALAGSAVAIGVYYALEPAINAVFQQQLGFSDVGSRLTWEHLAIAIAGSTGAAVLASFFAAWRAMRVSPAQGLRDQ